MKWLWYILFLKLYTLNSENFLENSKRFVVNLVNIHSLLYSIIPMIAQKCGYWLVSSHACLPWMAQPLHQKQNDLKPGCHQSSVMQIFQTGLKFSSPEFHANNLKFKPSINSGWTNQENQMGNKQLTV